MKPRIALLLGDPTGIGPEVAAKLLALSDTRELANVVLVGDRDVFSRGIATAGVPEPAVEFVDHPAGADFPTGQVSAAAGSYTLSTLRAAVEIFRRGDAAGIVYAPLNKQALKLGGMTCEDELHYFAALLGVTGTISEINVCDRLWTSRVTSHVPLSAVAGLLTADKIYEAAQLLHRTMVTAGIATPRIAIAALNPHAGEGGLIGTDEITTIAPAVERLRAAGLDVHGPLPADTLFVAACRGVYDGVVTMYHDQGQIALKLLGFDRGVTVAGGLSAAIATPAHGTAFDIVGKGIADPGAMRAAFAIACGMTARR